MEGFGRDVLGLLNPSKSITGLGDLTSSSSSTGDASSLGSLAGLLTLCLRFEAPLVFLVLFSDLDLDLRFRFLLPSSVRLAVPLGSASEESEDAIANLGLGEGEADGGEDKWANFPICRWRRGGLCLCLYCRIVVRCSTKFNCEQVRLD